MKLSILMPTFNDSETIIESLDSVKMQKNPNWELIIINDGSTDNTEEIINKYIKKNKLSKKIKYLYQDNQDQLRAIMHGIEYINGNYVMFLHSDDLLYDEDVVDNILKEFENNNADALFHNLTIINNIAIKTGKLIVKEYTKNINNIALTLLFLGRNIFIDAFIAKKEFFLKQIKDNYLTWNCPFWINFNDYNKQPNIYNSKIDFMKYRVHNGNYINNELGKLNVINGELRCATRLMKKMDIPFFKQQFYLQRICNKLHLKYIVKYKKQEFQKKDEMIKFILDKRFDMESWKNNLYLNNLYLFYKNNNNRIIKINKISNDEFIFLGCDMKKFNKNILESNLSITYSKIIKEMEYGFNKIIIKKGDKEKVINILKFLCIYNFVTIKEEN